MLASRRRSSSSVASFILAGSLLAIAPSGEAIGAITFVQEEGRDEGYSGLSDVLVSPEDGQGPPPWTTNSYAITPWLDSLRRLDALDVSVIVPGQGPAMRDNAYLRRTIEVFAAVIAQVQRALEAGQVRLEEVQAAVNVDEIGRGYPPGGALSEDFRPWVAGLTKKVMQESLDGASVK